MRARTMIGALALVACAEASAPSDASVNAGAGGASTGMRDAAIDAAQVVDAAQVLDAAQALDSSTGPDGCFAPSDVRILCSEVSRQTPLSSEPVTAPAATPFLKAEDFGADVRFTHVGGYALLAERGEGSTAEPFVVHITSPMQYDFMGHERAIERDAETQGFRAIAIDADSGGSNDGNSVYALLCGDERCVLFGGRGEGTPLTALPGGEVPEAITPRGVAHVYDGQGCVYGDGGFACHDGTGFGPIQLEGTHLHEVNHDDGWRALGEEGAFFIGYSDEDTYTAIDTGTTETLVWGTRYDALRGCWSAVTEAGRVIDNCDPGFALCDPNETPRFAEFARGFGHFVHSSGNVYQRTLRLNAEGPIWCAHGKLPSGDAVIGASTAMCGIIGNRLLLTEQALFVNWTGEIFCAID